MTSDKPCCLMQCTYVATNEITNHADELLISLFLSVTLVGIIARYCSPSYHFVKLFRFVREVEA